MVDRQARILEIIRRISRQQVTPAPDESLFDTGLLDSFALPDMVSALEQEFGIRVPDADLNPRQFESIARIDQYVGSRS